MKNLESFINQHKAEIPEREPAFEHELRFKQKLEAKSAKEPKAGFLFVLKVAAAAMLILFTSNLIYMQFKPDINKLMAVNTNNDKLQQNDSLANTEYGEAIGFFQKMLNNQLIELANLNCENTDTQKDQIFSELEELNQNYASLEKELESDAYDQRIIDAMIANYQLRINLINEVLFRLKNKC